MRVLFAGQRGGLGSSTAAATLALAGAQAGQRVLLIGMQGDSGVARALGAPPNCPHPQEVGPNLSLLVVDPSVSWTKHGPNTALWLQGMLQSFGVEGMSADLSMSPGAQELAAWLEVAAAEASACYDLVVLDAGVATAATRMAALPNWAAQQAQWAESLLPRLGAGWAIMAPMLGASVSPPNPTVMAEMNAIWAMLKQLPASIQDSQASVARLLLAPGSTEDDLRSFLLSFGLAAWHVDVVLHAAPRHESLHKLCEPAQLREWPQLEGMEGGAKSMAIAAQLWPESSPWLALERSPALLLQAEEGGEQELALRLPGISSKGLALVKRDAKVYLTVGKQQRSVSLPGGLHELAVIKAKCSGGWLKIRFARP